jgi:arginine repressor
MNRQNAIIDLITVEPDIGPTELTNRLNELGHSTSISTVKRDIKQLNGKVK